MGWLIRAGTLGLASANKNAAGMMQTSGNRKIVLQASPSGVVLYASIKGQAVNTSLEQLLAQPSAL